MNNRASLNRRWHIVILLVLTFVPYATVGQYWRDVAVYRVNKMQPHDRIIPSGNWSMSLDGGWKVAYPKIHGDDPMSTTYERKFVLPDRWNGRHIVLKVPSAGQGTYLFVNGREVGYSADSQTPAEWDITRYLTLGSNKIMIKTMQACSASVLECYGGARVVGIVDRVLLYSLPSTYISDVKIIATLDTADYATPSLEVMLDLNKEVRGGSIEVEVCGITARKKLRQGDWYAVLNPRVNQVHPWTDTTPVLYPMVIKLYDMQGVETERIEKLVGFRHVSIREGQLCVNGKKIMVYGANRYRSHGTSPSQIRRYLLMLKQAGFNAVRTASGPEPEVFYDLCDSIGLYVWDEANVKGDVVDYRHSPARDSVMLNPILDRVYNLYRRDRNHPSVVVWSLGSTCGNGYCMEEAYRFLRGKDNSRPVVYEGARNGWNTDIVCPPCPSASRLAVYGQSSRPVITSEYVIGHNTISEFLDTIQAHPKLQGGFFTIGR